MSIRKNILSGIWYTGLSRYSNVFVGIVIGAVLARLLSPNEFGVIAIVSVFTSFFNLLSSFGIGPAIIQDKSLTEEDISSIFSFSIVIGFFLSVIFFFSAPFIASFYNTPVLVNLSRLMALGILFHTIQVVPNSLNRKMLRFKEIGIISVVVHLVCGITAIILAYIGFSYYALVINSILTGLFTFIAYYILSPVKPSLWIQMSSIRKIVRFSTFQFLFNFINYFANHTDNLLIGKYFSAAALGFYDKSYKLMRMPIQNLTYVITPVLLPVLSEYQDDKNFIYNTYYKIVKLLAIIGFPLSVFLFFSGSEIIHLFYGSQWDQSIPIFRLLSLISGIYIILSTTGSIFQTTNRSDLLFYSGLTGSSLTAGGVAYGIFIGKDLVSVGYGLILASVLNFSQAFYLLIKISLNKSLKEFLKVFIFPFILSLSIALALYLISMIAIKGIILSLILKAVVTVLVFGIILRISKKNYEFVKEYSIKILKKEKK